MSVELRILGEVVAFDGAGAPVDLTRTHKTLMAVLIYLERPVSKERLLGLSNNLKNLNTVDVHVGEFRAVLEGRFDGQVQLLRTRDGLVRFEMADDGLVDYRRFRRQAARAATLDDDDAAVSLLGEALGEFRGPPLAGLKGPLADEIRFGIDADHRDACRSRLDRMARLGMYSEIFPEVVDCLVRWPGDERLLRHKIDALVADGRRADVQSTFIKFKAEHGATDDLTSHVSDVLYRRPPTIAAQPKPAGEAPRNVSADATGDLPVSDVPTCDDAPELTRLRNMSRVLADDLDVVGVESTGGSERRLSAGLYVERTRHLTGVVEAVTGPDDRRVLLSGEAGHGKSTVLWGVYHLLRQRPEVEPLLVSSAWLIASSSLAPALERVVAVDEVVRAAEAVRAAGRTPVVLLDTADLLLHSNEDRIATLRLCDRLDVAGARLVIACRPREAELLPRDRVRFELHRYDDVELRSAVRNYARVFAPEAPPRDPEAKVQRIMQVVARGLPVRDVCRSPLHLRMLFELYDSDFPLAELDVSGLYDRYRDHKVVTDRRSEIGYATGNDLSDAVEQCAVALLAEGRPELAEPDLIQVAATVASTWPGDDALRQARLGEAVQEMIRRGILLRAGRVVRFNHQTLFEYFAARGLITRDGERAADCLIDHMLARPADLFVGAVLEQVLVLLGRRANAAAFVEPALERLLAVRHTSLHGIALVVLAHHPHLKTVLTADLRVMEPATVRRYAQVAPTVRQVHLPELFDQLGAVWDTRNDECRQSVLEALEHLAPQAPEQVVAFLREKKCAKHIIEDRPDVFPTHHELPRTFAAIATADRKYAGEQLARWYEVAVDKAAGRDLCATVLWLVAKRWADLRDAELLGRFRDLVCDGQRNSDRDARAVREALGQLMAAEWVCDEGLSALRDVAAEPHPWISHVQTIRAKVEEDDEDTIAAAELVAIVFVLERLGPGHRLIGETIDVLLEMRPPRAPYQLGRGVFPLLFKSSSPAREVTIAKTVPKLEALPAPGNKAAPGPPLWAAVVRGAINNAKLAPDAVATMLADVAVAREPGMWLKREGLVVLLIPAAVGGHPVAEQALAQLEAKPSALDPQSLELVSNAIRTHLAAAPRLFPLLVKLAKEAGSATAITAAMRVLGTHAHAVLAEYGDAVAAMLDQLVTGDGEQQRDAMNLWRALERVDHHVPYTIDQRCDHLTDITDSRAIANFLTLLGGWAARGAVTVDDARSVLSPYVAIGGNPTELKETERSPDIGVMKAARDSLIQTLGARADPDHDDVTQILALVSAAPTDSGVFGLAGTAASTMAAAGRPRAAAELILRLMEEAVRLGLSDNMLETVANKYRKPVLLAFRHARAADRRWFLSYAAVAQQTLGKIIVSCAAQECFDDLEGELRQLGGQRLPPGVATQIDSELRAKARVVGSAPMPQLLEPYAEAEPAEVVRVPRLRRRWWVFLAVVGVLAVVALIAWIVLTHSTASQPHVDFILTPTPSQTFTGAVLDCIPCTEWSYYFPGDHRSDVFVQLAAGTGAPATIQVTMLWGAGRATR